MGAQRLQDYWFPYEVPIYVGRGVVFHVRNRKLLNLNRNDYKSHITAKHRDPSIPTWKYSSDCLDIRKIRYNIKC